jgi:MYXO-CTERM domain-containing protein
MPTLRTPISTQVGRVSIAIGLCLWAAAPSQAAPQYVNSLVIPGDLLDRSGGTTVNNGRFGTFSDIYYNGFLNQWWGLSDRGPGGGTISYDTRVQRFSLDVNKTTGAISNFAIQQTVLFTQGGQPFNGLAPNPSSVLGRSLDPEGFVLLPRSGNFLVSDEYGPSVFEFAPSGNFIRAYDVPSNLVPKVGGTTNYNASAPPGGGSLSSGREGNRGLEGLAVSPDGRFAYAMLQNGTITDGAVNGGSFDRSLYSRILKYDTDTGAVVGQFAYQLEATSQGRGISALVALDENRFLVLERNNRGVGVPNANLNSPIKQVFTIDLTGATDVSNIDLTSTPLPSGAVAVTKGPLFINLGGIETLLSELGNISPEKWEGLAVGPQLNDGSYLLLAGTDNDYSVTQNGTNTQFDVYFNPNNSNNTKRAQCDLGTLNNCVQINAGGTVTSTPVTDLSGYTLIPGVLQAWKVSSQDLGGYTPPSQPVPGPLPLLGVGAAFGWSRRLRNRIPR